MRRAIQRGESCACERKSSKTHLNVVNLQNERQLARSVAVKLQDLQGALNGTLEKWRWRGYLGASFTKAAASSRVDSADRCSVYNAEHHSYWAAARVTC